MDNNKILNTLLDLAKKSELEWKYEASSTYGPEHYFINFNHLLVRIYSKNYWRVKSNKIVISDWINQWIDYEIENDRRIQEIYDIFESEKTKQANEELLKKKQNLHRKIEESFV